MTRPNIVFILADDLGWCDLGCESSYYESPHIDRLAREGMKFTQAYAACQVCSPSRASIMTGKYPTRHGITDYLGARTGAAWRELGRHNKMLPASYAPSLAANEVTFFEALRRSGYRTLSAGKWHLGPPGFYPENFGFDINIGGHQGGGPSSYFSPWKNPTLSDGPTGEHICQRLAKEAANFIGVNKETPFAVYLSFYSVHCPIQTTRPLWEKYRQKAVARGHTGPRFVMDGPLPVRQVQDNPIYGGMIEATDDAVGIVLDALDQHGLADDTIVVFTSDNGGVVAGDAFSSTMAPLRGGKGRQWEGGIREPLFIRYPRRVQAGAICDTPVSGIDFYPTLLEMTGLNVPAEQSVDGRSFAPFLRGGSDPVLEERDLFWHYPHYGNQGGDPSSIIRSRNWKLIYYHEDGHDELYDLATDIGERHNVLATNPKIATELRGRLDTWLKETGAKFPVPDPQHDPARRAEYLRRIEHTMLPELEAEHARYLEADWQPNADWWGSQVVHD